MNLFMCAWHWKTVNQFCHLFSVREKLCQYHFMKFCLKDFEILNQKTPFFAFLCFKFFKSTCNQNFLSTPKEPLAKDLFTQISSKSIKLCRWRSVLSISEQQLQIEWPLDDLWPQIPEHPYSPEKWLHNWICYPSNRSKQIQETHTAYSPGTQYTRQSLNEKQHTWLHRQQVNCLWSHVYCLPFKLCRVDCVSAL